MGMGLGALGGWVQTEGSPSGGWEPRSGKLGLFLSRACSSLAVGLEVYQLAAGQCTSARPAGDGPHCGNHLDRSDVASKPGSGRGSGHSPSQLLP